MHTVNSTPHSHGTNESGADSGSGDLIGLIRPHYRRRCRGRSESVQCQLGHFLAVTPFIERLPSEIPFKETVRFRTVGDASCTGAVRSHARTIDEVIDEVSASRVTERGATRADDRFSEAAMEDRKREGYF